MNNLNINDRVYLKRIEMFFGHAVGNVISLLLAASLTSFILLNAEVAYALVIQWFSLLAVFSVFITLIEYAFSKSCLTIDNANRWITMRIISGAVVSLMFGLSAFILSETVLPHYEMYILVILICLVSLTYSSYTMMINYSYLVNTFTLLPFSIYLLSRTDNFYLILAITTIIIQVVFMAKGIRVSKSVISAIYLNEKLLDEIESHKLTKQHLRHMANHDMLTTLPNRHYLLEKLNQLVDKYNQNTNSLAVLYLDLDGFKIVNDSFGHDAGDVLLKEVANRIVSAVTKDVVVSRIGGDEFVLVIACSDSVQLKATKVKQELSKILNQPYYLPNNHMGKIGVSIGIAIYNNENDSADSLLKLADMAMYKTKKINKKKQKIK